MGLNNSWVGYTHRSFTQIRESIISKLRSYTPEITDFSVSNILIILVDIFAGIAEQFNYYLDKMSEESFIGTAKRYDSIVKHSKFFDYHIKASIPSYGNVIIEFYDVDNNPIQTTAIIDIPIGTRFYTENGVTFITTNSQTIATGSYNVQVSVKQMEYVDNIQLGTTGNTADQKFNIPSDYSEGSSNIIISGDTWELVETLGLSKPTDKHYLVDIEEDGLIYVKFGDNFNGMIPPTNQIINFSYYKTLGEGGNVDQMTIINSDLILPNYISVAKTYNLYKTVAGSNTEDIERIRKSLPLSLRTLNRAITKKDFEDLSKLAPGIDKSIVKFNCGKYIDIYVSPVGGGIANEQLINETLLYINDRKAITTLVQILPTGESHIKLSAKIKAKFRTPGSVTISDVKSILTENYSYFNSDINKRVNLSDIISLIDNSKKVDYINMAEFNMYLEPYLRPTNSNIQLSYNIVVKQTDQNIIDWDIRTYGGVYKLYKNSQYESDIIPGETYSNNYMDITISLIPTIAGLRWIFNTYPINSDIVVSDHSIPVIYESDITLLVEEQHNI